MRNYFQVPNGVFDRSSIKSSSEKLVYIYLCRIVNHNNDGWSSYTTIAEKCCITRRTAIRCVKALSSKNLILHKRIGKANHYKIIGI